MDSEVGNSAHYLFRTQMLTIPAMWLDLLSLSVSLRLSSSISPSSLPFIAYLSKYMIYMIMPPPKLITITDGPDESSGFHLSPKSDQGFIHLITSTPVVSLPIPILLPLELHRQLTISLNLHQHSQHGPTHHQLFPQQGCRLSNEDDA